MINFNFANGFNGSVSRFDPRSRINRIWSFVRTNPGATKRDICAGVFPHSKAYTRRAATASGCTDWQNCPSSTVRGYQVYAFRWLVLNDFLRMERTGNTVRYYLAQ